MSSSLLSRVRALNSRNPRPQSSRSLKSRQRRPWLEILEDRTTPSTITVNTLSDAVSHPGFESLRDAVTQADADAKNGISDAVVFTPGLSGTITLTQGVLTLQDSGGTGTITINGGSNIAVSGGGVSGVFNVATGGFAVIENITIENGFLSTTTTLAAGAGLFSDGLLTLTNCLITGNSITATGVPLSGNIGSADGAGFYCEAPATLANDTFSNNSIVANQGDNGFGAGFYCSAAMGTMTNLSFINNSIIGGSLTNIGGGGIDFEGVGTLAGCTISGNTVTTNAGAGAFGGGLYVHGIVEFSAGTTITGNSITGGNGGGMYLNGLSASVTIDSGVSVTNNAVSGGLGGGIYLYAVGITDDGIVSNNIGTGIYNYEGANCTLNGATVNGNTGGGIVDTADQFVSITSLYVLNSTIQGNSVTQGSGAGILNSFSGGATQDSVNAVIINSTIANNTATANSSFLIEGVGVFNSAIMTINSCTISGNAATGSSDGGGVCNTGYLTIADSTVYGNSASNGGGLANGIATGGGPVCRVSDCTVANNVATGFGGGIYNQATMAVYNTILAGNSAAAGPDLENANGAAISGTNNLVQNPLGTVGFTDGNQGNIVGHPALLATFGNWGGTTQTIPVQTTSPAVNAGGPLTRLTAGVNNSAGTLTVTDASSVGSNMDLFAPFIIQVDSEEMSVFPLTYSSNTSIGISRGYGGTTPNAHLVNAGVQLAFDQRGINRMVAGQTDIGAVQDAVNVVVVPPTVAIAIEPPAISNNNAPTFAFTGTDPVTPTPLLFYQVKIDGGAFKVVSNPDTLAPLAEGTHTLTVKSEDQAGNLSAPLSYTWQIDLTPPQVQITQNPDPFAASTSATFGFIGNDLVTPTDLLEYQVSLNGSQFTIATSPLNYTGLPEGSNTFQVEAIDQAGNVSTPKSYTWIVDVTPPTATITSKPNTFTNVTSAIFGFSGSDNLSPVGTLAFMVNVDNAGFVSAISPFALSGLSIGPHSFQVEDMDQAGNVSASAIFNWTIDQTPPMVTISQGPDLLTTSTSAQFIFSAFDLVSSQSQLVIKDKLDNAAFAIATSPASYQNLSSGSHTFTVEAFDQAGNVGTASYTWTVDAIDPTASINQEPAPVVNVRTATFGFTGFDNLTQTAQLVFEVSINGSTFAPATSPVTFSGLPDGSNTFAVEAIDLAGNVGAPASYMWTIDAKPPVITFSQKPSAFTPNSTALFAFTSTDNRTPSNLLVLQISFDGSAFKSATSPVSFTGLPEGSHTVVVDSTDQAGNTGIATYTWVIDQTPPTVSITQQPPLLANTPSATFAFTGSDDVTPVALLQYQISVDSEPYAVTTSPITLTNDLIVGTHTFSVESIDQAGNLSLPATYSWTVSPPPPATLVQFSTGGYSVANTGGSIGLVVPAPAAWTSWLPSTTPPRTTRPRRARTTQRVQVCSPLLPGS